MGIYNKEFINRIAINEVYFGETPDIKKLQACFSKFRKRCFNEVKKYTIDVNTYEELYEFNRQAEKTFGFTTFSLHIDMTLGVNACTFPITNSFDTINHKQYFAPTSTGMKYSKEANYSCIVFLYYDLLMSKTITDREVMAILLHEIGHNFSANYDHKVSLFDDISYMLFISDIIKDAANIATKPLTAISTFKDTIKYGSKNGIKFSIEFEKYLTSHLPNVIIARDSVQRIINNAFSVLKLLYLIRGKLGVMISIENDPIGYIEDLLNNVEKKLKISQIIRIRGLLGHLLNYNNERLADSFACMYGYSVELESGLLKISGLETKHYKSKDGNLYEYPLIIHLLNCVTIPINILFSAVAPHPTMTARMYNEIDYLEKEVKRNKLDPKMEKEILEQIKKIKKDMNKNILKPGREKDKADINMTSKMYYAYLYDKFEGGDYRNELFKKDDLHKQVQDMYDKKKKK